MDNSDTVIFLDVDGVLNDMSTDNFAEDWDIPSDKHLKPLADIVQATDARIVLSSSWRELQHPMAILTRRLQDWGLYITDSTPVLQYNRPAEIRAWLAEHPHVKHFVILDDEVDGFDNELADKFVRTYPSSGLLPRHVELATSILTRPY